MKACGLHWSTALHSLCLQLKKSWYFAICKNEWSHGLAKELLKHWTSSSFPLGAHHQSYRQTAHTIEKGHMHNFPISNCTALNVRISSSSRRCRHWTILTKFFRWILQLPESSNHGIQATKGRNTAKENTLSVCSTDKSLIVVWVGKQKSSPHFGHAGTDVL